MNRKEVYRTRDGTTLTTTDLVIAEILGGVNGFLMSDAGSGKSQLIHDIANAYFNGDLRNGGNSVIQTANNDFRIATIIEKRNPDKPTELELTGLHKACFMGLDEITRAHPMVANEFSDFGNGVYHRGLFNVKLGRDGYFLAIAAGNDPRKKENRGTYDWDGSMLNRFPLALDLGSDRFGIAGTEDDSLKTKIKPSTTSVLYCKPHDLTDKIIESYQQICSTSSDLGSEAEAVFYFLSQGANICPGKNGNTNIAMRKKSLLPQWAKSCVDCNSAKKGSKNSLCSLVNTENGRTLANARRYTSALDYVLKLKARDAGRELDYDPQDIAFLAFELCSGLQEGVLNQGILAANYYSSNEKMIAQVTALLKDEFKVHGDLLIAELEGINKFGSRYSVLKNTKTGERLLSEEIPPEALNPESKDSKLHPSLQLIEPKYESSGTVPWDFAPKVISQLKEEKSGNQE
ncbi:hypothetical protein A3K73_00285 [Candidatus Pacearchaeota archaeon RBG_13_36_9]|nr:MAG: hypothetical protein A3K73_00285 [Candidatus Pacearchaeota archaeon RBG_13_36_9]